MPILLILIVGIVSITGCANLSKKIESIKQLNELGKSEKDKTAVLEKEQENFQAVKEFISSGQRTDGISLDIAREKFGKPLLTFSQDDGQRWVYKSSYASWFSGEKIYLFFDREGMLINWECLDFECPAFAK